MKNLYKELDFFGFVSSTSHEDSYELSLAREMGILKSLNEISATKDVYNAKYIYTYSDNRFNLKLDNGYIIKGK